MSRSPADHARAAAVLVAAAAMVLLPSSAMPRSIEALQRPLRIAQSWGLYGGGPNKHHVSEIRVDGVLRFRSGDPEHTWLRSELRYRRIRPVIGHSCRSGSENTDLLLGWLAARARMDFPGATEVELRCMTGEHPGRELRETGRVSVRAPDWEIGP